MAVKGDVVGGAVMAVKGVVGGAVMAGGVVGDAVTGASTRQAPPMPKASHTQNSATQHGSSPLGPTRQSEFASHGSGGGGPPIVA